MTLFMNDPYLCSTKAVADKSHTSEGKTKLTLGSSTVGFQPSQNVIVRPWIYMSFIIIQIYFHALLFI